MLITEINNLNSIVQFGNRGDVCVLTARALAVEERIDIGTARNRLKGHVEGKRVVKFRQSGSDIVISLEMIHKIAKEFPLPEDVVIEDDETEKSE